MCMSDRGFFFYANVMTVQGSLSGQNEVQTGQYSTFYQLFLISKKSFHVTFDIKIPNLEC